MGLQTPSRGLAKIGDFESTTQTAAVRRIATFAPPEGRLDPQMSPRSHLQWVARFLDLDVDATRVRQALRFAEIPDRVFDSPSHSIPSIFHVLTWIALYDLRRHQVLVLDDPAAALSFSQARALAAVLRSRRNAGAAILVTTRDAKFAEETADRTTWIEDGRVQVDVGEIRL